MWLIKLSVNAFGSRFLSFRLVLPIKLQTQYNQLLTWHLHPVLNRQFKVQHTQHQAPSLLACLSPPQTAPAVSLTPLNGLFYCLGQNWAPSFACLISHTSNTSFLHPCSKMEELSMGSGSRDNEEICPHTPAQSLFQNLGASCYICARQPINDCP